MLHVVRSARADQLVEALGDLLDGPVDDPVAAEVVAVPSRGVERWLAQRLADRFGVCANVAMPSLGTLARAVTAAASGIAPDADPWRPEALVWPLVEVLDAHLGDPVLAPLAAHLAAGAPRPRPGEPGGLRRLELATAMVGRFEHYALDRPSLVQRWAAGGDTGTWQGHLWQLLRAHVGCPSPAERLAATTAALASDPSLVELPARLGCFGLTRMARAQLSVLAALATHREVTLYLLHPSEVLWQRVAATSATAPRVRRSDDATTRAAANPLLRSWGRDVREAQLVLAELAPAAPGSHRPLPEPAAAPSLLQLLQADIRGDRVRRPEERAPLDPADRSVQVHACHGRARQVEVLRDAVAHLLADDPGLELRDVIVMCPDIEEFAPLVHATFGVEAVSPAAGHPDGDDGDPVDAAGRPRLRVRLADRSLRQTNPLLGLAATLLELADGRVTATDVLGLVAAEPVARRFRLDRDDLALIEAWVAESGVRWGLDEGWRLPWKLDGVAEGTWRAGSDRLLLGVAMAGGDDCRTFGGVVPLDDLPSSAIELAGRMSELVDRLGVVLATLAGRKPAGAWLAALASGVRLLGAPPADGGWQLEQLDAELADAAAGLPPGGGPDLTVAEIRHRLDDRLKGRPTRAGFRTGDLTVCTLVPMRSVPHRVVALLGLDDGSFPRHPEPDGDDLLGGDEACVGDRDPRTEDRQLLLDALMAASDTLLITYSGRDERTNRRRPPAVPVAELLDVVDATVTTADGAPARRRVRTHHPLQPHDGANFTAGRLGRPGSWAFDAVQLRGARATRARHEPPEWLADPLPPLDEPVVDLDDLVSFVGQPVAAFLRRRIGLWLGGDDPAPPDALQTELDNLERWGVGQRLLDAVRSGTPLGRAVDAERARGTLPPAGLGEAVLAEATAEVEALVAALAGDAGPTASLDVHLELPDGRAVVGTVPGVRGDRMVVCTYSRLKAKQRLASWVRHLARCAARPDLAGPTVLVGRGPRSGRPPARVELGVPMPAGRRAAELLGELVDLRDRGMRAPLPLACDTSAAYARATLERRDESEVWEAVRDAWADTYTARGEHWAKEQSDRAHEEVWGVDPPLGLLTAAPPLPDEALWPSGGSSRFAALALRLWTPLLAAEGLGR